MCYSLSYTVVMWLVKLHVLVICNLIVLVDLYPPYNIKYFLLHA